MLVHLYFCGNADDLRAARNLEVPVTATPMRGSVLVWLTTRQHRTPSCQSLYSSRNLPTALYDGDGEELAEVPTVLVYKVWSKRLAVCGPRRS